MGRAQSTLLLKKKMEFRKGEYNSLEVIIREKQEWDKTIGTFCGQETFSFMQIDLCQKIQDEINKTKPDSCYVFLYGTAINHMAELIQYGFICGQETTILKKWLIPLKKDLTPKNLTTSRVGVLIKVADLTGTKILIVKENGRWKMPSGTCDLNENPIETAKRELMEELSIEVDNFKFIGGWNSKNGVKNTFSDTCFVLQAQIKKGFHIKIDKNEIDEWYWQDINTIQSSKVSDLTKKYSAMDTKDIVFEGNKMFF